MPTQRPRDSQRSGPSTASRSRPPSSAVHTKPTHPSPSPSPSPSPPLSKPKPQTDAPLQRNYDTYAENIHAISVRHSSHTALSSYGAVDDHKRRHGDNDSFTDAEDYYSTRSNDGRLTAWQTAFHLISFMAGSGLVFLPLALVEMHWYGLLVLVVAALICIYTAKLLIEAMDILRWTSDRRVTYCDLARACMGAKGEAVAAVFMHGGFLVSATGYIALVTSCIVGMTGASYGVVLFFVGATVWSHVLVDSLASLAVFSAVNVGVCFWVEAVIFGDAMYPLKQISLEESAFIFGTPDLSQASLLLKLAYSFSLLASGFFCHSVVPTFYNAMQDHDKCSSVVLRSQTSVLTLLYLPVCVVTYAVYGATLQAPVFFNMRNPVVRNLAIVLYCVHLLLSYVVTLYPLQRAMEKLLVGADESDEIVSLNPATLALMGHTGQAHDRYGGDRAGVYRSGSSSPSLAQRRERGLQLISRTATVVSTVVLAYVFQPTTLHIFGAMIVPATTLALIFPCVFFWTLCTEEASWLDKSAIVVIIALAVGSMVASVVVIVV